MPFKYNIPPLDAGRLIQITAFLIDRGVEYELGIGCVRVTYTELDIMRGDNIGLTVDLRDNCFVTTLYSRDNKTKSYFLDIS